MRAIGYVRVSTDEQQLSPVAQRERITAYCTMVGTALDTVVDANGGESGGQPLAQRAGGQELLEEIARLRRTGEKVAVVAVKLDRLFRDAADCLQTVREWDGEGVSLHIVDLGGVAVDTRSAAGRFMLTVLAAAAEMERNLTRERTRDALRSKRDRGQVYGPVPYGYRREGDRLVEEPTEQRALEHMRKLRADGLGYHRIADALNELGWPAKANQRKASGRWHASSVRKVLQTAERLRPF
jgi:DNA invertase Pin-like site-specific DNA recombinase